ncbi:hypothetical protein PAPYR_2559 [Paratrimastix pyriformis]|uniref:Protein YIPF n=1 Tax=Paratrimastix pyriformis TaxID=342808 RepID=A0ABQ8UPL1_9EUKA|nr:hypothetical protein PAPYR_2559 [Paratrimastix pyriformis]
MQRTSSEATISANRAQAFPLKTATPESKTTIPAPPVPPTLQFQPTIYTEGNDPYPFLNPATTTSAPNPFVTSSEPAPPPLAPAQLAQPPAAPAGLPVAPGDGGPLTVGDAHFWKLRFWQRYFNVDTKMVGKRLLLSLIPITDAFWRSLNDGVPSSSSASTAVVDPGGMIFPGEKAQPPAAVAPTLATRRNSDLYGPFWIITSLIFLMGIVGNLASWFEFVPTEAQPTWRYNFYDVTYATASLYPFLLFCSGGLWLLLTFCRKPEAPAGSPPVTSVPNPTGANPADVFSAPIGTPAPAPTTTAPAAQPKAGPTTTVSLVDMICVVGYSFTVYLPVAIVSILPWAALRWVLIVLACAMSAAFVCRNLWGLFMEGGSLWRTVLFLGLYVLASVGISLFMEFFFFVYAYAH